MTKADEAYTTLAEMIETARLKPGDFWTEAGLVEELGMGRTPLREAIQRLDRDHLVRIRPGRGIEIPSISVDDQLRRLEVRRSMESLAVTLACARATDRELAAIGELTEQLHGLDEVEPYLAVVRETHVLLSAAAHNEYLSDTMTPLQGLSRRFWLANIVDPEEEVAVGKSLHLDLLTALLERDAEKAQRAVLRLNDYLVDFTLNVAARNSRVGRTAPVGF
ncbi:GntR family transcriptional regulator [Arthrobacter crystallopoietes BAB-32]|uniref:GntR family transcriptional regulator n=1 Tax=Arthrobacter crystallopoietes BAB-32 TaxID=1246476 RepID=N1VC40_9MICC|nr:GntR family transcriptional regulator [Arthrobacter crystallopoietes]EMY35843.1 GntR family transcriptional regulator [Arthrobacter crystallopoietes BAB-32]